jgi:hypothetical protein
MMLMRRRMKMMKDWNSPVLYVLRLQWLLVKHSEFVFGVVEVEVLTVDSEVKTSSEEVVDAWVR